jgi:hypothetical protein
MPTRFVLSSVHYSPGGRLGAELPEDIPDRIVARWIDDDGALRIGPVDFVVVELADGEEPPTGYYAWDRVVEWFDPAKF